MSSSQPLKKMQATTILFCHMQPSPHVPHVACLLLSSLKNLPLELSQGVKCTRNDNKETGVMEFGKRPDFPKQIFKSTLLRLRSHQFPVQGDRFSHCWKCSKMQQHNQHMRLDLNRTESVTPSIPCARCCRSMCTFKVG